MHAIGGHDTILGRGTITTYAARTSEEILNIHGVRRADLIIADESLPLMGGARLCSMIRSDADLKTVSIIMACDATEPSLSQCREAGANVVLPKPVDPGALFWKASELLVVPQRKDMRTLLRISIKGVEGDTQFSAQSQNISISGMLLETDQALKLGERLTCAINIAHNEIIAECMVTRASPSVSGRHGYGVKFINCDAKSLVIIEHFVKTQARP